MNVYLDASVVVSLFVTDSFAARARAYLTGNLPVLVLSDFASAEFVSAVSRRVRMQKLKASDARIALANFDIWAAKNAVRVETSSTDVRAAEAMLRRLDLTLRTPDAINIAIAQRVGAELATFDENMTICARTIGAAIAAI